MKSKLVLLLLLASTCACSSLQNVNFDHNYSKRIGTQKRSYPVQQLSIENNMPINGQYSRAMYHPLSRGLYDQWPQGTRPSRN